jgi:hypothetical protein
LDFLLRALTPRARKQAATRVVHRVGATAERRLDVSRDVFDAFFCDRHDEFLNQVIEQSTRSIEVEAFARA